MHITKATDCVLLSKVTSVTFLMLIKDHSGYLTFDVYVILLTVLPIHNKR